MTFRIDDRVFTVSEEVYPDGFYQEGVLVRCSDPAAATDAAIAASRRWMAVVWPLDLGDHAIKGIPAGTELPEDFPDWDIVGADELPLHRPACRLPYTTPDGPIAAVDLNGSVPPLQAARALIRVLVEELEARGVREGELVAPSLTLMNADTTRPLVEHWGWSSP